MQSSKPIVPVAISPPLTVETLVNGGNGLIRYNGQVIFVPGVAAGDVIRFQIVRAKKRYAEAKLVEIVTPSTERCQPQCPVAHQCGGCQWQHLPYPVQLTWKEKLFRESLTHKAKVADGLIKNIIASPHQLGYRSRVQIKCRKVGKNFLTGFYQPKSKIIVDIESCPLMPEALNQLWGKARQTLATSHLCAHISQLDLAIDSHNKYSITVHYNGGEQKKLTSLLLSIDDCSDIFLKIKNRQRLMQVRGDGLLTISVDNPELSLSYEAGSFAQINLPQNNRMISEVIGLIPWQGTEVVLDLYCGMGNFSLPIARRVKQVIGIEASSSSIKMAKQNAYNEKFSNTTFLCANSEEIIDDLVAEYHPDVLVLDPPRSGAYDIVKKIAKSHINHIIYVSCDPQTLARDMDFLVNHGYHLKESRPIDMFPQTYHCESISYFNKNGQ